MHRLIIILLFHTSFLFAYQSPWNYQTINKKLTQINHQITLQKETSNQSNNLLIGLTDPNEVVHSTGILKSIRMDCWILPMQISK